MPRKTSKVRKTQESKTSVDLTKWDKFPSKAVIRRFAREFDFKMKRSSNEATSLRFRLGTISIIFKDARILTVPLALHPTLQKATAAQRRDFRIEGGEILSWDQLDYHLSVMQMLNPFGGCCGW